MNHHFSVMKSENVITSLKKLLGDRVSTSPSVLEHHGRGEGLRETHPPDVVVFPTTTKEVAKIVSICHEAALPVIPFGAGTSLEGHVTAPQGGVCLDLSGMKKILKVNSKDLDCQVEAGVTRSQLNKHLKETGLFFPIDPGADATLGGMAATRASGTNAVLYGTMKDVVLGLTIVTPEGKVIKTGGRARKSSTGYDLTRLYVGSEGTLGVITELGLRIFGRPEQMASAVCQFPDLKSAIETVILCMQVGLPLARIELLDDLQMKACISFSKLVDLKPLPSLFLEFHGTAAGVVDQVQQFKSIATDFSYTSFKWATTTEQRSALWKARHEAYYAGLSLKPGAEAFATDACVPISSLADCILETRKEADESGLTCPIVGHVGDGNFHALVLFDPGNEAEKEKAEALVKSISLRAIKFEGTCSGEHGVGTHKLNLMYREHGNSVKVMQEIKRGLDPKNIMNPGKTVPEQRFGDK